MMCGVCDNVAFIKARDGEEAAIAFAKRTAAAYRHRLRAVKGLVLRPQLIKAYMAAKRLSHR